MKPVLIVFLALIVITASVLGYTTVVGKLYPDLDVKLLSQGLALAVFLFLLFWAWEETHES